MAINHQARKKNTAQGTAVATTSVAKRPSAVRGKMPIMLPKDFYKLLPENCAKVLHIYSLTT